MAFSIKRSDISEEQAKFIRSGLCIQPDVPYTKYKGREEKKPVVFFRVIQDIVHIPFLFAASLFKTTPNFNLHYPMISLEFTGKLRENQILVEQESWQQLETYGTSTLALYPGFGKTILGAHLASRSKLLTCVLVHREILTHQWKKTFVDNTNGTVWIVGEDNPPSSFSVIICMDTRWSSIPQNIRDSIGFLIIDEAHAFCTQGKVDCLLSFHPKYILLESASLERDDGMHTMMYAIAGTHGVFRENNKPFSIIKINTNTKPIRQLTRMGTTDWPALVNSIAYDERRNGIIVEIVKQNIAKKILILTALREHSVLLNDTLCKIGINSDYLSGRKKGYVDSNVLVGTISKIGTGFDPANFCPTYQGIPFDLVIIACSMKKESVLTQNIGRGFRSDFPTIVYLVDKDTIFTSHWYNVNKWCKRRGGILNEINIPNPNLELDDEDKALKRQQDWLRSRTGVDQQNPIDYVSNVTPGSNLSLSLDKYSLQPKSSVVKLRIVKK